MKKEESAVPQIRRRGSPADVVIRMVAALSAIFHRDVTSFCDLATCDRNGLITFGGDYVSIARLGGTRRMTSGPEIEAVSSRVRVALSSLFGTSGHALQFCYVADPDGVDAAIERNLDERRAIAAALNAEFDDIFAERRRILPPYMRQERIWLVLWTRPARLSTQELRAVKGERRRLLATLPPMGDAQNPLLGSLELGTIHQSFAHNVVQALANESIQVELLGPEDGLKAIREEIYPETLGGEWQPSTPLSRASDCVPDEDDPADVSDLLWPPLREQLFRDSAVTPDFTTARLGVLDWSPIELARPPEVPHAGAPGIPIPSFTDLASKLASRRMPWRATALIEAVRPGQLMWKDTIATFLKFGANLPINAAFAELKDMRARQSDTVVKLRMAFATCAPAGAADTLRIRASRLEQAISAWGGAAASRICGDPLAGVLSSVPGLAIASTAPPAAGPLSQILAMMPWARPGKPWTDGAMLFRAADGTIVPYDAAGSGREAVLDLFVAPSRRGKSSLANALLFATVLSTAALTAQGARLPLIGKLDIGDSSSGFVDMVLSGLRAEDQHLALHVPFQLIDAHSYNIFDTEACCRAPLHYHKTFLSNFLSLVCKPLEGPAFESMNQLIEAVIPASYEYFSDHGPSVRPKPWRPDTDPMVDAALLRHRLAVPTIGDLIEVVRLEKIRLNFEKTNPTGGSENIIDIFRRYITHFVDKYPTLNKRTQLDLGDARIVVVDIDRVAPQGQGEAQRQTELMYLLGFQITGRNFFLHPDDAEDVPRHVRAYHRRRFEEFRESFKRIECDEFQRTAGAPFIQKQFEEAARRAAKLNVKIGLASQKLGDFGEYLISHSTGRFILGAGDEAEAAEISERFQLSAAARVILRQGLNGPRPDGSGAPLIWQTRVNHELHELFVFNLMGPIELWALSTSPKDASLRRRLYQALGTTEARRRLARVFPHGTAEKEIERREQARMRAGQDATMATSGVIEELAEELRTGIGLGAAIRQEADQTQSGITNGSAIMSA